MEPGKVLPWAAEQPQVADSVNAGSPAQSRHFRTDRASSRKPPVTDAWRAAGGKTPTLALPVPVPLAPQFDSSRAKQELGWTPRSLVDGVRDTFRLEGR